jgi:hypothetical protein
MTNGEPPLEGDPPFVVWGASPTGPQLWYSLFSTKRLLLRSRAEEPQRGIERPYLAGRSKGISLLSMSLRLAISQAVKNTKRALLAIRS